MFNLRNVVEDERFCDGSPVYSGDLYFEDNKIISFVENPIDEYIFPSGQETDKEKYQEFLNGQIDTDKPWKTDEIDLFDSGISNLLTQEIKQAC